MDFFGNGVFENGTYDWERAFYGKDHFKVDRAVFDGPADGESAFKECRNLCVDHTLLNLRYPFWHDDSLLLENSTMTENCRASLWYSSHVTIRNTIMNGIKALRECSDVRIENCQIQSPEFGWSTRGCVMKDTSAESEYFMMRSDHLVFTNVEMKGKYSFQYITDSVFDHCTFDTKDAFWHGKNLTIRDCVIKGEYLGWYSENLIFENCTIIGTQPLCYCKNLILINCEMIDTDLCFERSEVYASITTPVESIKNPLSGHIEVPHANEVIFDIDEAFGEILFTNEEEQPSGSVPDRETNTLF